MDAVGHCARRGRRNWSSTRRGLDLIGMRLRLGFAAVALAGGYVLTLAQHAWKLSDGLVLGLMGALVVALLMLADRIDGGSPPARPVPKR